MGQQYSYLVHWENSPLPYLSPRKKGGRNEGREGEGEGSTDEQAMEETVRGRQGAGGGSKRSKQN